MPEQLVQLAIGLGWFVGGIVLCVLYYLFFPDQAQKAIGGVAGLVGRGWRRADKTAVALKVQGEINQARASLLKAAPAGVMDRRLKIKWTDAENAEAALQNGEVIVFMQPSRNHAENVANAVMAYLPKAVIPRARPYIDSATMQAADLTLAKAVLTHHDDAEGTLDVFYARHLDPARAESELLKLKLSHMDQIDLHGWLSRILLAEYRRLGDQLHPGEPDAVCVDEAEQLADWLWSLADRAPGEFGSLRFEGRYLRVAVIFVANRHVLAADGVEPYRKRAKRHIYQHKFDSVYLLARDANIAAVEEIADDLQNDGLIDCSERFTYELRPDFKARVLNRERAICVCLRRRNAGGQAHVVEDADSDENALPDEVFTPDPAAQGGDEAESAAREPAVS